jgi:hypothetical protein
MRSTGLHFASESTATTLWVMATAIIIAVVIMLVASKPLGDFVERHPTVKMLALSFLLLIGMTLIADGAGFHVPKGYICAAIAFSVGVEALNQFVARRRRINSEGGFSPDTISQVETMVPAQPAIARGESGRVTGTSPPSPESRLIGVRTRK